MGVGSGEIGVEVAGGGVPAGVEAPASTRAALRLEVNSTSFLLFSALRTVSAQETHEHKKLNPHNMQLATNTKQKW